MDKLLRANVIPELVFTTALSVPFSGSGEGQAQGDGTSEQRLASCKLIPPVQSNPTEPTT